MVRSTDERTQAGARTGAGALAGLASQSRRINDHGRRDAMSKQSSASRAKAPLNSEAAIDVARSRISAPLRQIIAVALMGLLCLASASDARAGDAPASDGTIALDTLIPYAKRDEIPTKVRKECGMGAKLSRHIVYRGQERGFTFHRVGDLKQAKETRRLSIRITDALELKGGISPSKTVTIDGVLKEKDTVIGTFEATRFAQASFFPLVRSDCKIYSKAIKKLAKDVAAWLEKPAMGSRLGDVR